MIERHWDGIAAYCKPENKVALDIVERLNNKIRVLQRRAYGLRDEECLRLKVITSMLASIGSSCTLFRETPEKIRAITPRGDCQSLPIF